MEILIKILQFILSFSLLVIVHELGHFLFAKMFGMRVERFYLFFNPWFSLVKFRLGETEYGIGWIPFGGYVKIAGMVDESMDTKQLKSEPQPWEFRSKPAWQRLLTMLGGVIMNVVLALFIYIGMTWAWGDRYIANDDLRYGWAFNEMAHEIGFRDGDRILSVDGQRVENAAAVYPQIVINNSTVEVLRDGKQIEIEIPPQYVAEMLESTDFMTPRVPFVVSGLIAESGAERAGILPGDSLVAIDGQVTIYFDEYLHNISGRAGQTVEITLLRDSSGVKVQHTLPVEVSQEGRLGLYPVDIQSFAPLRTRSYSFLESIPAGVRRTGVEIKNYLKQIVMIFTPETKAYKSLGGPIGIFNRMGCNDLITWDMRAA